MVHEQIGKNALKIRTV